MTPVTPHEKEKMNDREWITQPYVILLVSIMASISSLLISLYTTHDMHVLIMVVSIFILGSSGLFVLLLTYMIVDHYAHFLLYIITLRKCFVDGKKRMSDDEKKVWKNTWKFLVKIYRVSHTIYFPDIIVNNDSIYMHWKKRTYEIHARLYDDTLSIECTDSIFKKNDLEISKCEYPQLRSWIIAMR